MQISVVAERESGGACQPLSHRAAPTTAPLLLLEHLACNVEPGPRVCPSPVEEHEVSYLVKFGEEPMLCVLGLRMKRDEIKRLKAQLLDRDKVIQTMKGQEAAYLAQADSFKVSSIRIINRIM